ncbi:uncharacterized protein LOC124775742 [Schistocerca piceifrons]|uniref:uncharacterized protein LOC124775742 n=1 Tax=Schistocerca piceifrons TaxID=274613 RepID=UPI001F5ECBD5|nr:uncharacterized protein LOC124775742 [Schistocerca piceifrons]
MLSLREQVIVAGDFNSKHGACNSRITNAAGPCLLRVAERHHALVVGPYDPTIFPAHGQPDKIDIAVVKGIPHQITTTMRTALSSDHVPVVFDVDLDALQQPRRGISLAGINWDRFQAAVTDSLAAAPPPADAGADAALLHFAATTIDAAKAETPPLPRTPPDYSRQLPPNITEKNRVSRPEEWQRTRNANTKHLLNRMHRDIRAAIDNHCHRDWNNKVATQCLDNGTAWRTTKSFLRRTQCIPPLIVNGQAVCQPAAKVDGLADVFEAAFTSIEDPTNAVQNDLVADRLPRYSEARDDDDVIEETTAEEVSSILRDLNPRKAGDKKRKPPLQKESSSFPFSVLAAVSRLQNEVPALVPEYTAGSPERSQTSSESEELKTKCEHLIRKTDQYKKQIKTLQQSKR